MESIDIMVDEHENIKRVLKVMRKCCYELLLSKDADYMNFYKIIGFVRNYADGHHHAKEENILFKTISEESPKLSNNGPITGMLIEHDLGRLYMTNLEKALEGFRNGDDEARLDIIANTISYADLLERHIEKENNVIYKFANNILPESIKKEIDNQCDEIDSTAKKEGIQEKYLDILEELEEKMNLE